MLLQQISTFFESIKEDNRITTSHISVYMALIECWKQNNFQSPIPINRSVIMQTAKISGIATYHKCIKGLDEFGYIKYIPSYHPAVTSVVYLLEK